MAVDIAAENALTEGRDTLANLVVNGHGDATVAGFARRPSVNVGEMLQFSVTGPATVIDVYRVGWYGGDGFRLVATLENTPTVQPEATVIPDSNGATSCTAWSVTAQWSVPADATSGLYLALVRSVGENAPNAFYISFVVRDDAAAADIVYKTSDSTWGAAYNHYGTPSAIDGKDLYGAGVGVGNIMERSFAVSYHRPVITRGTVPQTFWMACEMPLIRWLERNGYAVKYVTSVDVDLEPELLDAGNVFLSSGHDEYWTTRMRDHVEAWRDAGAHHSLFLSGNEVFWRARYETVGDETIMWCHKDTMPGPTGYSRAAGEPLDPVEWTGTWKDTRWPDNRPEWLLTGTDFRMNGINDHTAVIPSNPYGGHKVWGGSSLVDADLTLQAVVGFEADEVRPTQPDGAHKLLAAYTRNIDGAHADDNGQNYTGDGDLQWGIVSQRYDSGAVTVGFGTCQWAWALDAVHDRGTSTPVSAAAQQFTMNLLRDLGASPGTLQADLELQPVNALDEYGRRPVDLNAPTTRLRDGLGRPIYLTDGQGNHIQF